MSENPNVISDVEIKWYAQYGYVVPTYNIVRSDFAIMPRDMPSEFEHLWSAFEHSQTEVSAAYILRYCQEQGNWAPFSEAQINAFYRKRRKGGGVFYFNRLIKPDWNYVTLGERNLTGGGWIVRNPSDGLFYVTDEFIYCVHRSLIKK